MTKIIELTEREAENIQEVLESNAGGHDEMFASKLNAADPHAPAMLEIMRWVMVAPMGRVRELFHFNQIICASDRWRNASPEDDEIVFEADNPTDLWEAIKAREGK